MTAVTIPAPGEVHVHRFQLDRGKKERARLHRYLSSEEMDRADRLLNQLACNRFVVGRGMLREILSGYLELNPGSLRIAAGDHGKPELGAEQGQSGLCFNLSHADGLALLAVSGHCELGIDLELQQDDLPFQGMAAQFFSCREQAELFSLPEELQLGAFYRCWTRKEAYLKGCGSGFHQPADSFDVSLLPGQPPALLQHRTAPDEPKRWQLMDITVPDGFYATLAVKGEVPVIRYIH